MIFTLVVPAAGTGSRLGYNQPKALVEINGVPLFVHAIKPFLDFPDCVQIVIAAPITYLESFRQAVKQFIMGKEVLVVSGGQTRQDSVRLALDCIHADSELVLIHDAARPLVSNDLIKRVAEAIQGKVVASAPALPVTDTIKYARGNPPIVCGSVEREGLFAIQTPQAIVRTVAIHAHQSAAEAGFQGTDDTSLIERFTLGDICLVEGDPRNIKLTTQEDLARVCEILQTSC